MRRYPLSALVTATGLTEAALGRLVGLSGSTLKKAREWGFTADAADRYANRAGLHPAEVWTDYGLICCASHRRIEVAPNGTATILEGCDVMFAPKDRQSIYCSGTCRRREKMRRYRARPHGAANNRRYRQDYLAWERERRAA